MLFNHKSILLSECLDGLNVNPSGIYVDCTLGGGGHSEAILKEITHGFLLGIDRDIDAIHAASKKLSAYNGKFIPISGNFFELKEILHNRNIKHVDGILADLGVSSYQLDTADRGFSYKQNAPLDMRMNQSDEISAKDVINEYSEKELYRILSEYGEEKWSHRISKFIVDHRKEQRIETTDQLVQIIKAAIPLAARRTGPHPAKRSFQAIRIEVNHELQHLQQALKDMIGCLNSGGRLAVISFHSLEDRIVKKLFLQMQNPCTCSPKAPLCTCGLVSIGKIISKKPILPSEQEIQDNPRSRSAKLRILEKN